MITLQQLGWIAGLLEGEGSFRITNTPAIRIGMSDLDIIEKFRILTKTTHLKVSIIPGKDKWKTRYYTGVYGDLAIQWIMTLYPLMGIRRREKIREIIQEWKEGKYSKKVFGNSKRRQAIKAIAFHRKVSIGEAERLLEGMLNKTIQ